MAGPQQVLAINEGLVGEDCQSRRLNLDDTLALESSGRNVIAGELAVRRVIRAKREEFVIGDIAHASLRDTIWRQNRCFRAGVKRAAFPGPASSRNLCSDFRLPRLGIASLRAAPLPASTPLAL